MEIFEAKWVNSNHIQFGVKSLRSKEVYKSYMFISYNNSWKWFIITFESMQDKVIQLK